MHTANSMNNFLPELHVAHTKPLSRLYKSLSESRSGSKVTKPIFRNGVKH